jgi:tellurite resistance protein
MRHYKTDTPEALARIVVAAILADGGLDKTELQSLEDSSVIKRLGTSPSEFDRVVHEFCDDLQIVSLLDQNGQLALDRKTIDHLLADVRSPELQMCVLRILLDIVSADGTLSPGEAALVSQAMTRWGLELHSVSSHRDPISWPTMR